MKGIDQARAALQTDRKAHDGMTRVLDEIELERRRQIEKEGWTLEHDDKHSKGEMSRAALNYVAAACVAMFLRAGSYASMPPLERTGSATEWPWAKSWWKPGPVRRMLIKAAALIVAEIERIDREGAHR